MAIKNLLLLISGFMIFALSSGCAVTKPVFEGNVIDAETKAPIEGAVVVATYEKQAMGLGAGALTITTGVQEALTDSKGHFRIGYHIMFLIPVWHRESSTIFIVFKPGYASVDGLNLEDILSKDEVTTEKELPWLYNKNLKFVFANRLIGLPKVSTLDERRHAGTIGVSGYTKKDLPLFYKARDEEDKTLLIERRRLENK